MHAKPSAAPRATILVVDDDALINLNTVDMLEELGHAAVEAFSGREALQILADRSDIDVLVTDHSMPGMTGVELAAAARALRPNLPVLLATGYSELPDGVASDLPRLEKPFGPEDLGRKIAEILEHEPS